MGYVLTTDGWKNFRSYFAENSRINVVHKDFLNDLFERIPESWAKYQRDKIALLSCAINFSMVTRPNCSPKIIGNVAVELWQATYENPFYIDKRLEVNVSKLLSETSIS